MNDMNRDFLKKIVNVLQWKTEPFPFPVEYGEMNIEQLVTDHMRLKAEVKRLESLQPVPQRSEPKASRCKP